MNKQVMLMLLSGTCLLGAATAVSANETSDNEGYYVSVKATRAYQKADSMDTSARPGIGSFVSGEEKDNFYNSSLAAGYNFGNGWRVEGEYTFKKKAEYTSGSTTFPTSFNHMKTENQRFMANVYKSFYLDYGVSVYGTVGLGVVKTKTGGWQGNATREYANNNDTNLAYSIGAGVSYALTSQIAFDLGYRFVDLGKVESGMNQFANARGLQDEQMKGHLYSNEFFIGARYTF
ncbi:outer membrane beta-barrel protein [Utexia brackfieldae]|uniref:outer membrane protein n=1 Tax=Utexia brackfieldae TaxID=3074108 RepID=UPI00370D9FAD